MLKILLSLFGIESEPVKAKQTEIDGTHYTFHSLPKEFQVWLNTHFILEKRGNMDRSTVPTSLLNAYMWLAIQDGTSKGFWLFQAAAIPAITIPLLNAVPIHFILALMISAGVVTYIAYHYVFYARLSAQVAGPVTQKAVAYTAGRFTSSLTGTFSVLTLITLPLFLFMENVLSAMSPYLAGAHPQGAVANWFFNKAVKYYNALVDVVSAQPETPIAHFLSSPVLLFIFFAILALVPPFIVRNVTYKRVRRDLLAEWEIEKMANLRPFARAKLILDRQAQSLKG